MPDDPPIPDEPPVTLTVTAEADMASQATLVATLSAPASVAAACVRRDLPEEVHLLEADRAAQVELRFTGLLPATTYDCVVAPTDRSGERASVTFVTRDPPSALASADVERDPALEMTGAYTVMTVRPECDGRGNYIAVLDPDGNNRWRHDLPPQTNIGVEVLLDGPGRFLWGGGKTPAGAPTVVDVADGEQWSLAFPGSDQVSFHHDVHRVDDGRILSVEEDETDGWRATQLRLSDESGETSWFWDIRSAVDSGWLEAGSAASPDPHHVNWADVVETPDGLVAYLSLCYEFQVIAVDVATGGALWTFGHGGDFRLQDADGQPLSDDEFPQCQHGVQTDGTHLLLYDNGFNRGFTRAVEFTLDLEAGVATKTWDWRDEGFWELYHGGTDWLDDAHERVLVAQGNNGCDEAGRHSQIVEVDRTTDTVVHRLILRDVGDWIYRAHRIDGCDLFADTRYCPARAERFAALKPLLGL